MVEVSCGFLPRHPPPFPHNSPSQTSLPITPPDSHDSPNPPPLILAPSSTENPVTSSSEPPTIETPPSPISSSIPPPSPPPILHHSDRPKQQSVLLRDFHCGQVGMSSLFTSTTKSSPSKSGTQYPLSSFISYQSLSPTHQIFINNITSTVEPRTYEQTLNDPKWCEAMQTELTALEN
ncbi:hypothetical protein SADUNF_Sadunf16G0004000 [Salix dunnii]|uniref:Uncharacterized protein n=1 Tax=Salix dunnii TaxID=1413687 RepID=A0A835JBK8_9ROSI|nr:hypothetical protein SADUNF_Sadunf16G0004000 [Salix dunnii]